MIKNVRDILALALLLLVIPGLWALRATVLPSFPDAALGATISVWTLIAQFYFRKSSSGGTP